MAQLAYLGVRVYNYPHNFQSGSFHYPKSVAGAYLGVLLVVHVVYPPRWRQGVVPRETLPPKVVVLGGRRRGRVMGLCETARGCDAVADLE